MFKKHRPPGDSSLEVSPMRGGLWWPLPHFLFSFLFFFFFFVFCPFRATPMAYGGSQARGLIGAVATSLHHSPWQRRILNPLSKARDRTHNLMVPSRIRFHCNMTGTPTFSFFYFSYQDVVHVP